jgi:RNA polymerase sigma-70 factor (ECF subfamily)
MNSHSLPGPEEAVRRFLAGDEEAFTQIVRQWESRVYNLALRFLGNREDAQDVAQDTFLSVFRSIKDLRDPGSFRTWMYRVALNHCRARWRSRPPESSLDEPVGDDKHGDALGSLDELYLQGSRDSVELKDLIQKALMGLSQDHRQAIILKEYLGLSLEEVAQVMECPLSTAKSRLYHGLRGVQRHLLRLGARS